MWRGHVEAFEILARFGAPPEVRDTGGETPAHFASDAGSIRVRVALKGSDGATCSRLSLVGQSRPGFCLTRVSYVALATAPSRTGIL